jgi:hypothetical protein
MTPTDKTVKTRTRIRVSAKVKKKLVPATRPKLIHSRNDKVPNATTRKALGEIQAGSIKRFANTEELYKDLGI